MVYNAGTRRLFRDLRRHLDRAFIEPGMGTPGGEIR